MLSQLREAWVLVNAVCKSIRLAKEQTTGDLKQSYLMRAEMEAAKLKQLIETIAKQLTGQVS
jgi:hypothetical protein